MPTRRTHLSPAAQLDELTKSLTQLRASHEIPEEFPPSVLAEATAANAPEPELDLREIPFVTIDPVDSLDLDQAFHLERVSDGFVLRYAIADVPGFVRPNGEVDAEARRRGQTFYLPDCRVPLHPPVLSEDRASLLPDADRTAYVWTIPIDRRGAASFEGADIDAPTVQRARVRSRAKLDYASAQSAIDAGTATEPLLLLQQFGTLRIQQEQLRGGASLNMADEEVVRDEDGYRIVRGFPLEVEDWNAQLSLLTGMTAARIMLNGGVGILRTMPPPSSDALSEFRERISALGQQWDPTLSYGEYLRTVPRGTSHGVAVLHAAASLFRGAGYAVFGVPGEDGKLLLPPEDSEQAAIAAAYTHVTAPLRRLVDRWALVICEALSAGTPVPDWVLQSLPELPTLMRSSSSLAVQVGAEALDRIEAALLKEHIGETLPAVVVQSRDHDARVQIEDPPITANASGSGLAAGDHITVRVMSADIETGEIELRSE
ncbi:MAG: RNB domain-containing ribonuclease [Leucobacter sp.]